jgi:hypothetical protein
VVARDGIAFEAHGYDLAKVNLLPWLDGVSLSRKGSGYAPIDGMPQAAELLARARADAEPIYRTWQVVSLEHLASDSEIEVRCVDGLKVIFAAQEDYFRQLARLQLVLDDAGRLKPDHSLARIDLSLGAQVPVAFGPPIAPPAPVETAQAPAPVASSPVFFPSSSPSPTTREF